MQEEHRLILMLARFVDLVRKDDEGTEERREALDAVTEHADRQSSTIRFEDGRLSVEGLGAPQDVPFVRTFIRLLESHGLAEIRIAFRAAPIDILHLARTLTDPVGGTTVRDRLHKVQATTVTVWTTKEVEAAKIRRQERVSSAILGINESLTDQEGMTGTQTAAQKGLPPDFVPAQAGAAYGQMLELEKASSTTLAAAVRRLRGHPDGAELSKGLNAAAAGVTRAVREKRAPEAIDALIAVIHQEEEEKHEDIRLRYGVALRRVLQTEVLTPLIEYLLDPLYAKDVALIMKRAGDRGTQILLDLLVEAPTFAERRAYMQALEHAEAGTEMLVGMLDHHEWFVVRNVSDLIGEMQIQDAVPALGRAAEHSDSRVRLSAGLALAKIGTPLAMKFLGKLLRDEEPAVRSGIVKHVKGTGLGALAMPLVNAASVEDVEEIECEIYRALGRIGSKNAVEALLKVAEPVGMLKARRVAAQRVAAVEGLASAGTDRAVQALRELKDDRDKGVRSAAQEALGRLRSDTVD